VFGIGAAAQLGGVTYAFLVATGELATFDLTTGGTNVIGTYDAGVISAAVPTPEPATTAFGALGLAVIAAAGWMRKRK
jgi:MYXO-CTERM domain-containing protein